jgi:DNA-binding transcriptional LysR family regulator
MKQSFTVRQGALDGVEAFLSVARHRSFRRAADELGVTTSAVSQAVRALEARVGVALFIRTTRSVGLTEAGERFHARARPAFEELVSARDAARQLADRPSGLLRLTVPRSVVSIVLEPIVASFCRAYPEVQVEVVASETLVDLAAEGFDAGVRMGQFIAPDMVTVRLSPPFRLVVVCSPSYLVSRVAPESPAQLIDHACLRWRRSGGLIAPWTFDDNGRAIEVVVKGPYIANDFPTLISAAIAGVGLAQVPEPVAARSLAEGKLQHVLAPFAPLTPGVFLYHPGRHQVMPKLRAFIEHVKANAGGRGQRRDWHE